MDTHAILRLTARLYLFTFAVFLLMQALVIINDGAGAQEPFELFRPAAIYASDLMAVGDELRLMLMLDLLFMIGYGGAIGLTAWLFAERLPLMAWLGGLGVLSVVLADLLENTLMLMSLDLVEAGEELPMTQVLVQAQVSGLKWFLAALSLVSISFVLPRETWLENLLVWLARITMPLGAGLFVTGAFDQRLLGGLLILAGMGGGLGLLSLIMALRVRRG